MDANYLNNNINNKICLICGDKSNGYHFNAITCESCKSFFRRNALKYKDRYKCYSGGNCMITVDNRIKCKKCRLDRCFSVGMKTNLFFSEQQKQLRKQIIEKNKRQQKNDISFDVSNCWSQPTETSDCCPEYTITSSSSYCSSDDRVVDVVSEQTNSGQHNELLLLSTDVSAVAAAATSVAVDDGINSSIVGHSSSSSLSTGIVATNQSTTTTIMKPITDYSNQFNELEANKLTELLDAMKLIQQQEKSSIFVDTGATAADAVPNHYNINVVDNFMQAFRLLMANLNKTMPNIIKMAKRLQCFTNNKTNSSLITESDQLILLKYSLFEIHVLRNIQSFNYQGQYWTQCIDDNDTINGGLYIIYLSVMKNQSIIPRDKSPYDNHEKFINNMGLDWESDPLIVDLLTIIILLNANRPQLQHKQLIKQQQLTYIYLLKRYLSMKYKSQLLSDAKVKRLLSNLCELNIINDKISVASHRFDIQLFPPLVREILFDR